MRKSTILVTLLLTIPFSYAQETTLTSHAWQDGADELVFFTPSSLSVKDISTADFSISSNGKTIPVKKINKITPLPDGVSITLQLDSKIAPNANNLINFKTTQQNLTIYPRQVLDQAQYYFNAKLGLDYHKDHSQLALWAPSAKNVSVYLYPYYNSDLTNYSRKIDLQRQANGVWQTKLNGDQAGNYYVYAITLFENGKEVTNLVADPYSSASSPNSEKSYIYDETALDKRVIGWDQDKYVPLKNNVDAVIYELHVRDYTIDQSSGIESSLKGKFLGLAQDNSHTTSGVATGLANIKELGVTHVQLLPVYDYGTGDETSMNNVYPWYNWGYDPVLYSNIEGSYATNPVGTLRQEELKTLITTLHRNNLGVIKDVVFNHTFQTGNAQFSIFDKIVPFYFYRVSDDGVYSNGSYCGNEVATEKPMVRKFIVDSIRNDVSNYHVDGFRFDLMGLIDTQTMLAIQQAVKAINPSALIIGEGWNMPSTYPSSERFIQANTQGTGIAAFNDGIRDNLRGDVFNSSASGFVQGSVPYNGIERLKQLIKGAVTGRDAAPIPVFSPNETVNYVSVHDNATLIDKISSGAPKSDYEQKLQMDALAFGAIATSQGILLLDEGQEFGRTKHGNENSYASNDPTINPIQWNLKQDNQTLFKFYQTMIALRKSHPAFRMNSSAMVESNLQFISSNNNQIVYQIKAHANDDQWGKIMVLLNASSKPLHQALQGTWQVVVNGIQINQPSNLKNTISVPAYSIAVLHQIKELDQ